MTCKHGQLERSCEICEMEKQVKELETQNKLLKAHVDYAFRTITEYETSCGAKVNDAFRIGWYMARTTNAHMAALQEQSEVSGDEMDYIHAQAKGGAME